MGTTITTTVTRTTIIITATGIITTAIKRNLGDEAHLEAAVASMLQLNKRAAELAQTVAVHSVTDITGYGLLGHGSELARNSGVGLRISAHALPALPGALQYAGNGVVPGGLNRNHEYVERDGYVRYLGEIDAAHTALLFDPQTSGGLLIALPPADADALQARYAEARQACWRIGEVIGGDGIEIV